MRGCRFLEFAVHGGGVTVSDPFEEKDEGIDGSGVCVRESVFLGGAQVPRVDLLEVGQEVWVESP